MLDLSLIHLATTCQNNATDVGTAIQDCFATPFINYSKWFLGPIVGVGFVLWQFAHERTQSVRTVLLEGVAAVVTIELLLALAGAMMHTS